MTSLRHQDYKNGNTNGGQKKLRKPKLKKPTKRQIIKAIEDRILETLGTFLSKKKVITNH